MKSLFFVLVFSLLTTLGFAQNVFFDVSTPNGGPSFNYGGRVTFFTDILPKFQVGIVGRAHRIQFEDLSGAEGAAQTLDEVSLGAGFKYYFFRDVNSTDALYVNPNLEVNSLNRDNGFDMSLNVGYTRVLTPLLRFNAELGTRHRTVLYQSAYGKTNRLQVYMGFGFGLVLPYYGNRLEKNAGKFR